MVACLVLATIALTAAASIQYARSMSVVQRDRRTALEMANSRLEDARGAAYASVRPSSSNYNVYYVSRTGSAWQVTAGNPNETTKVNGRSRPITTTVQYVDVDGGSASYDCIRLWVSVQYSANASNLVILETLKSP